MSKVIAIQPTKDFKARSKAVLDDPGQRKNFRGAMDFLQAKRRAQFGDQEELQSLRDLGAAIRRYSLAHAPRRTAARRSPHRRPGFLFSYCSSWLFVLVQ